MTTKQKSKNKKGSIGHKTRCQNYKKLFTREKNKERKLVRHLKKQPNDKQAENALQH